ncbi:MAG: hypothetical protein LBJ88_01130 [Campylobacteraceae bacterium]|jgi:hypothetical protein|nr:hypothetical protein [Campylobacteraceae bacterium]
MLNSIKNKEKEFDVQFPSQSFFELWKCYLKDDIIFLEWTYLNEKHNANSKISLNINLFIKEWLKLLDQIKRDLEKAGYNKNNLEDFYLLENLDRYLTQKEQSFLC